MVRQEEPLKAHGLEVSLRVGDGTMVVSARGDVDMLSAPTLRAGIEEALSFDPRALVIDLTGVAFLACAGLSVLMVAHSSAGFCTRVAIVAVGRTTTRPIVLTGVDRVVPLYPSVTDAVVAIGN